MRIILALSLLLAMLVVGGSFFLLSNGASQNTSQAYEVRPYIEIEQPAGFVNTEGEAIEFSDFVGEKVILFDFMTYSCINCQRVFPYLSAWYETYEDDGLIVIGVHTPEFAFERDIDNVAAAAERFGLNFPIVLDNEYATWRAYGNRFWPRKYLIDIHGNIVYDHIGEGAYEETEQKIRELLTERKIVLGEVDPITDRVVSEELEAFVHEEKSPETYLGSARNEYLLNPSEDASGLTRFEAPSSIESGGFYLVGQWGLTPEYAESGSGAKLLYRYSATDVFLVAGSVKPIEMEVWLNGAPIDPSVAGADVVNGVVQISENRLYRLVEAEESGEHVLELRPRARGMRLFAFTFG